MDGEQFPVVAAILVVVFVFFVVFVVLGYRMYRRGVGEYRKTGMRPRGYYIGLGMVLGLPLGVPLAVVTGNPGLIGAGVGMGLAVGVAWEERNKDRLRPLTVEEENVRKQVVLVLAVLGVLGVLAFLLLLVGLWL